MKAAEIEKFRNMNKDTLNIAYKTVTENQSVFIYLILTYLQSELFYRENIIEYRGRFINLQKC